MNAKTTHYNEHDSWPLDRVEATADWFDHVNPSTKLEDTYAKEDQPIEE